MDNSKQSRRTADDDEFETVSLLAKPGDAQRADSSRPDDLPGDSAAPGTHRSRDGSVFTITAAPTSPRFFRAIIDCFFAAFAVIPFVLTRGMRIVCNRLGIPEHRWRGAAHYTPLSADDRRQLRTTARDLQAGTFLQRQDRIAATAAAIAAASAATNGAVDNSPPRAREPWSPPTPAERVLSDLQCILAALAACAQHWQLEWHEESQAGVHAELGRQLENAAAREELDLQSVLKRMRKAGKEAATGMVPLLALCSTGAPHPSEVLREYLAQLLFYQSQHVPLQQRGTVLTLPGRRGVLQERSYLLPLNAGREYLELQGPKYAAHAEFMRRFNRLRPSDAKRQWQIQGMTINARYHGIVGVQASTPAGAAEAAEERYDEVYANLRSGAFAVHGRKPPGPGLAGLVAEMRRLREATESVPTARLQSLEEEAEGRRVLVVAQALPVVLASVRKSASCKICLKAATKSGSFLHVQQSLLSDMDAHERAYLEDTQGALEWLSQNVTVRFSSKPFRSVEPTVAHILANTSDLGLDRGRGGGGSGGAGRSTPAAGATAAAAGGTAAAAGGTTANGDAGGAARSSLTREGGSSARRWGGAITLWLDVEDVPLDGLPPGISDRMQLCDASVSYGLSTALFSQGFNILQSISYLTHRNQECLSDALNCTAVKQLNDHAERTGLTKGPALAALNRHYSPAAARPVKDMESIRLVRLATTEVGGSRAVNCKSGKDRTAIEASTSFAQEAVAAGLVPADKEMDLRKQFHAGLSFQQTGQNSGLPNAYAFNEMELAALPSGWRVDWRLCGKVAS